MATITLFARADSLTPTTSSQVMSMTINTASALNIRGIPATTGCEIHASCARTTAGSVWPD